MSSLERQDSNEGAGKPQDSNKGTGKLKKYKDWLGQLVNEGNIISLILRMCALVVTQEMYLRIQAEKKKGASELNDVEEERIHKVYMDCLLQRARERVDHERGQLRSVPVAGAHFLGKLDEENAGDESETGSIIEGVGGMKMEEKSTFNIEELGTIHYPPETSGTSSPQPGPSSGSGARPAQVTQHREGGVMFTCVPKTLEIRHDDLQTIDPTGLLLKGIVDRGADSSDDQSSRNFLEVPGSRSRRSSPAGSGRSSHSDSSDGTKKVTRGAARAAGQRKSGGSKRRVKGSSTRSSTQSVTKASVSGTRAREGSSDSQHPSKRPKTSSSPPKRL